MDFNLSSDGTGMYIGARTSQIAVQTSKIIFLAVETPVHNFSGKVVIAFPVARYLDVTNDIL